MRARSASKTKSSLRQLSFALALLASVLCAGTAHPSMLEARARPTAPRVAPVPGAPVTAVSCNGGAAQITVRWQGYVDAFGRRANNFMLYRNGGVVRQNNEAAFPGLSYDAATDTYTYTDVPSAQNPVANGASYYYRVGYYWNGPNGEYEYLGVDTPLGNTVTPSCATPPTPPTPTVTSTCSGASPQLRVQWQGYTDPYSGTVSNNIQLIRNGAVWLDGYLPAMTQVTYDASSGAYTYLNSVSNGVGYTYYVKYFWNGPSGQYEWLGVSTPASAAVTPTCDMSMVLDRTTLFFNGQPGGANPAEQSVTVTNGGTGTFSWAASSNQSWLTVSPASGSQGGSFTVTASPTALAAGTYTGTITVSAAGPSNTPRTVSVTLTVTAPPVIGLSPTSLSYNVEQNAASSQAIAVSNAGGGTLSWSATSDKSWLTLAPLTGQAGETLTATVDATGLQPGTDSATITLTAPGAETRTVAVSLQVTAPPVLNVRQFGSSPLDFTLTSGGSGLTRRFFVRNLGGGTLAWTANVDQPWLSLGSSSGTVTSGSVPVTLYVSPLGVLPGTYTGHVTFTAPGAVNSPITLTVNLTTTPPPVLAVEPTALQFSWLQAGDPPPWQVLQLRTTSGSLGWWTASADRPWALVTPSGYGDSEMWVGVDTAGLAAGTYSAVISVAAPGADTLRVPVALTIQPPDSSEVTPQQAVAEPGALEFSWLEATAAPAWQILQLSATSGSLQPWTASADQPWVQLSRTFGYGNGSLSVGVNVGGLAAGAYSALVSVSAGGPDTLRIPVGLTIYAPASIEAPEQISLHADLSTRVDSQVVVVRSTGSGPASWSASIGELVLAGQPVFTLLRRGDTLIVKSDVPVETWSTSFQRELLISVGGFPIRSIPVLLTIVSPPRVSVSPASLTFSRTPSGAPPSPQSVVLSLTNATGPTWSVTPDGLFTVAPEPWNSSMLTVAVRDTPLSAGTYTGSVQVTASGSEPVTLPITLQVTDPGTPPVLVLESHYVDHWTQLVHVRNGGGGSFGWTAAPSAPWITVSRSSGVAGDTFTYRVDTTGLTPGYHSGSVTVTAPGAVDSPRGFGVEVNIPAPPDVSAWWRNRVTDTNAPDSALFWVENAYDSLSCSVTGSASSCAVPPELMVWLNSGTRRVTVTYNVSTGPGSVTLIATSSLGRDSATTQLLPTAHPIVVTPDDSALVVRAAESAPGATFTIRNFGALTDTVAVNCVGSGQVLNCVPERWQWDLYVVPAGGSVQVPVSFTRSASGSGTVSLTAKGVGGTDRGSFVVDLREPPPAVSTDTVVVGASGSVTVFGRLAAHANNWRTWFQLSTAPDMSAPLVSPPQELPASTGEQPFQDTASVARGKAYFYRAVAAYAPDSAFGAVRSFQLHAAPGVSGPDSVALEAGTSDTITFRVANANSFDATFSFSCTAPAPLAGCTPPPPLTLGAGDTVDAPVVVTATAITGNGQLSLSAQGAGGSAGDSVRVVVVPEPAMPPSFTHRTGTFDPLPNNVGYYVAFLLRNNGTATRTYQWSAASSNPAAVSLPTASGSISLASQAADYIYVYYNTGAAPGQSAVVRVSAADAGIPAYAASDSAIVSVAGVLSPTVEATGSAPSSEPGAHAVAFIVTNHSLTARTFTYAATTSNAAVAAAPLPAATSHTIAAGASDTILVTYSVPVTATGGTQAVMTFTATDRDAPSLAGSATAAVAIPVIHRAPTVAPGAPDAYLLPGQTRITAWQGSQAPVFTSQSNVTDTLVFTWTAANPAIAATGITTTPDQSQTCVLAPDAACSLSLELSAVAPGTGVITLVGSLKGMDPATYGVSAALTVHAAARPSVTFVAGQTAPRVGQTGRTLTFRITNPYAEPRSYDWSAASSDAGVAAIAAASGSASIAANATQDVAVTYSTGTTAGLAATITLRAAEAGFPAVADSAGVMVTLAPNQPPVPTFTATPSTIEPGAAVAFDGAGSSDPEGDALTYLWQFGDGATATGATASHVYAAQGTFAATLVVTDALGARDSAARSISVVGMAAAPETMSPMGVLLTTATATRVSIALANPGTAAAMYRLACPTLPAGDVLRACSLPNGDTITVAAGASRNFAFDFTGGAGPGPTSAVPVNIAVVNGSGAARVDFLFQVGWKPPRIQALTTSVTALPNRTIQAGAANNPWFQIWNDNVIEESYTLTCAGTGAVADCASSWSGSIPGGESLKTSFPFSTASTGSGTLTATAASTHGGSRSATATVSISSAANLSIFPASMTFAAGVGGPNPGSQTVYVSNVGGGSLTWIASVKQSWLTITPASGSAGESFTASASVAGLAAGAYVDTITVTATGAVGSPARIPVTFTVSSSPALAVGTAYMYFSAVQGAPSPASRNISISNVGAGDLGWTASADRSWVTLASTTGSAGEDAVVSVNTSRLAAGDYRAVITVSAPEASNSPQTVRVDLHVAPSPVLNAWPASLTFKTLEGGASPAPQTVAVYNTGGGSFNWSASSDKSWLTLSATSGPAGIGPSVSVNGSGLAAATYPGNVTITAPGIAGSPKVIPVSFEVVGGAAAVFEPSALNDTVPPGGSRTFNVLVRNPGSSTAVYTMQPCQGNGVVTRCAYSPSTLTVPPGGSQPLAITLFAVDAVIVGSVYATADLQGVARSDLPMIVRVAFRPSEMSAVVRRALPGFDAFGDAGVLSFWVVNPGTGPMTYRLSCGTDGSIVKSCYVQGGTSITVPAQDSTWVPVSYTAAGLGTGTLTLTATMADGLVPRSASWTLPKLPPANRPPVACASLPQPDSVVPLGTTLTAASCSTDPDGDTLTLDWYWGDGAVGHGVGATHSYAMPGSYIVILRVSDGHFTQWGGLSVRVTGAAGDRAPSICFSIGPIGAIDSTVVASSCSSDPDGDPISQSWDWGDGTISNTAYATHRYAAAGDYVATLRVSDGRMMSTSSVPFTLTPSAANGAPVACFGLSPSNGAVGTVFAATSCASDPDGDPLTISYDWGDGHSGPATTHAYATAGSYTVTQSVSDTRTTRTAARTVVVGTTSGGVSLAAIDTTVRAPNTRGQQAFSLTALGTGGTYQVRCSVDGTVLTRCTPATDSTVMLADNETRAITVADSVGASTGTGFLTLAVFKAGTQVASKSVTIIVAAPGAPIVVLDTLAGATIERGACLSIAAGSNAAYECGDLRIVHALPATRTLNKLRVPTLIYNSQHAQPTPVIAASVQLPSDAAGNRPTELRAVVTRVDGSAQSSTTPHSWTVGTDWQAGQWRRITLTDPVLLPTGGGTAVHRYIVQWTAQYPSGPVSVMTDTAGYVVVDRSASPFGAGWWLAGLERLQSVTQDTSARLWMGGDGSTRVYAKAAAGRWIAPTVDSPDELVEQTVSGVPDARYVRLLPGGVRVVFDYAGRHIATVNRVGHITAFTYRNMSDSLSTITLPVPSGASARVYTFGYPGGGHVTITAPPAGNQARVVSLQVTSGHLARISGPDATGVGFDPTGGAGRVTTRTDRLGHTTSFAYDGAGRLRRSTIAMQNPADSIVRTFYAQESRGFMVPEPLDSVRTVYDGPRTDSADVTEFRLDAFGAPTWIKDAHGAVTQLFHGDTRFPALVTRVEYPATAAGQRRDSATYNARGNPLTQVQLNPYGNGNATTSIEYTEASWPDFPTKITSPANVVTEMDYDDVTGNRMWQQDGRGAGSRVRFGYTDGLLTRVTTPEMSARNVHQDFTYDALGNLATEVSPAGHVTSHYPDGIGRDTAIAVQVNATDTLRTSTVYDLVGMDTLVVTHGDTTEGDAIVRKTYDLEGRLRWLERSSKKYRFAEQPQESAWWYDYAGRLTSELSPQGRTDYVLDHAGNVKQRTRDNETITMVYDALDRLRQRVTPGRAFGVESGSIAMDIGGVPGHFMVDLTSTLQYSSPAFPSLDRPDAQAYVVPTETATFDYDTAGRLWHANNPYAQITRAYYPGGALQSETQVIAGDTYTLGYTYDLDGRRQQTTVPAALTGSTSPGSISYAYVPGMGALQDVTSALMGVAGVAHHEYDWDGRIKWISRPGGLRDSSTYDAEGMVHDRTVTVNGVARLSDLYTYDWRGKIIGVQREPGVNVNDYNSAMSSSFSLIGTLRSYADPFLPVTSTGHPNPFRITDAFGNAQSNTITQYSDSTTYSYLTPDFLNQMVQWREVPSGYLEAFHFAAVTEYLPGLNWTVGHSAHDPDADQGIYSRTRTDFDAAGKLRLSERWTCKEVFNDAVSQQLRPYLDRCVADYNGKMNYQHAGAFEDFYYDALGRRVISRSIRSHLCHDCLPDRRVVAIWDGDQLLGEVMRQLVDPTTPAGGSVMAYVHGSELDHPLAMVNSGTAVLPITDWRGKYFTGYYASGSEVACTAGGLCLEWPGKLEDIWGNSLQIGQPYQWFGSVINESRTDGGLKYMRNRYYDPASGRFTQEDPIGLAGGLNLYGFANGDPVNFSDPFGLDVCLSGLGDMTSEEIATLKNAIADGTDTNITWSRNRACVRHAEARGTPGMGELSSWFLRMVEDRRTFWFTFGPYWDSPQFDPMTVSVFNAAESGEQYRAGPSFGQCTGKWSYSFGQVIAHEMVHHFPIVAGGTRMNLNEQGAVVRGDNAYNAGRGRPLRCQY